MNELISILELALLVTAYIVTTRRDIPNVIRTYSIQSFILSATGILIALNELTQNKAGITDSVISLLLVAALPLALGFFIEQVLARATVYEPKLKIDKSSRRFFDLVSDEQKQLAHSIWLKQRHIVPRNTGVILGMLTLLSFSIVFLGNLLPDAEQNIGVSVSLALHLIGLYNTFLSKDILSQVIGILTMDQGMYLAILKVVNIPAPAILFVIALYLYTAITLLILFLILPQIRHKFNTLSLDEIVDQSELEG